MRVCRSRSRDGSSRRCIAVWAAALAFTLTIAGASSALAVDVTFPDPNLEAAVRTAVGVPAPEVVTDTDMLGLTQLIAADEGIRHLDGLEYAVNLGFIALPDNEITDVSPLSGLSQLRTVYLNGNRITDIGPLCALPGITDINLNDNRIAAVPHIAWTNPYFLQMNNNRISDLSGFDGLAVRFESIDLRNNKISDLSPLSSLHIGSPMSLYLSDNKIDDISPLLRAGNMTYFYLYVERNYLDLSAGSAAMDDITTLTGKEAIVTYVPQKRGSHADQH